MKKFLFLVILLVSFQVQAGLGWFLLGAASTGGSSRKPAKNELEVQIAQIKGLLPPICSTATHYSKCWSRHNQYERSYSVADSKSQEILAHFQNKGYKVELKSGHLIFDFRKEYQKYLLHEKVFISLEYTIFIVFFSSIALWVLYKKYKYKNYVKKVKKYYENNPKSISFSEKTDQVKLEESLDRLTIPPNWNIHFSKDKEELSSIGYYNGSQMGIIAFNSAALKESLSFLYKNKIIKGS